VRQEEVRPGLSLAAGTSALALRVGDGEIWGDMGRYAPQLFVARQTWGDMGRHGEIWGDMGRYGEICTSALALRGRERSAPT